MDITNFLKAGYSSLFIETVEIKRAVSSITFDQNIFKKLTWNSVQGITELKEMEEVGPPSILNELLKFEKIGMVLENFDIYLENPIIIQKFLNSYEQLKNNQTCAIIVGTDAKRIPVALKELIPVIQFDLPSKNEVKAIAEELIDSAWDHYSQKFQVKKGELSEEGNDYCFDVNDDVIEACLGMSHEEIENALALSWIEKNRFDVRSILDRKREIIRATGFMDFIEPEPIENLGGLDLLKDYIRKRHEAFKPGSTKPKVRSILIVGMSGTGKSLASKCIASEFNWPGITLDIGSLKGGIVGETERNTRLACKTIDAFGKAIVTLDEIEKGFAGSSGQVLDSGVSSGMLGYFLTWMQERKSEGILVATANNLSQLPPEFLRAGRWDTIFFVDLPNVKEIASIIQIMNRRYDSKLPFDNEFCKRLFNEGWTGAEIEQLAKDSHFDDVETAMKAIPLLSNFKKEEIAEIRKKAEQFRRANIKTNATKAVKKLSLSSSRKFN
jgi:ATP-dependent 26S proteasome regulatory subunit